MRLPWSKPTLAERALAVINTVAVISAQFVLIHEAAKRFHATFIADKAMTPAAERTVGGRVREAA